MQKALPFKLHFQNPIDQISIASLICKSQCSLQPVPLQLRSEFGLPEGDHTRMQIHSRGQRDEVPCVDCHHHLIVGEGVGKDGGILGASKPNMHSSLSRYT